ncbi:uncharacterized protein LOC114516386 [Dendronephthya gigantea]|uniref:uncharacterized protein LOC114516386 n=1 Tax=Dendronephthya gigantea TaxID=151771 RepID=UPI0010699242|nr:uncharacterized protein LOC114516386 [Dendronephthya gigantea]
MSLLNQSASPRLLDKLPTMAQSPPSSTKPKSRITRHPCTPFCDAKVECPKHHDLVLTLMNCNNCAGAKSNILQFQKCVIRYIDEGWDKDDVVPDPSEELRFPLVHLACGFGKSSALDWLIQYGFEPNLKSESTGQFPLHCAIRGLHRSKTKTTSKELVAKLKRIMTILPKQLLFHDEVNGDTPLHTAAVLLTTMDQKFQYFQSCIEAISNEALKMDCPSNTILDAINYEGKTALHLLASASKKVEFCAGAIRALVSAGADKTIRDNNGETALDIAFAGGVQNLVQELLRNGEQGIYSELDTDQELPVSSASDLFPSPSRTDDSDAVWNERASSRSSSTPSTLPITSNTPGINDHSTPTMALMEVKQERILVSEENCGSPCACSPSDEDVSAQGGLSNSPAVLKYLGDAGLLGDVTALVARARAQDEANMRRIETRANEIDIQIKNKEHCIQKMKQELSTLKNKRKECDSDFERLKKRMHSCESAMKELPSLS